MSTPRKFLSVLGAAFALLLPLLIGTMSSASAATLHEWTLSGVTFDDGGTLSGTVVIDDGGAVVKADLATAGGNTALFTGNNFTGNGSDNIQAIFGGYVIFASDFTTYVLVVLPDTSTASVGDSLPLSTSSYECGNCSPVRFVASGSIVKGAQVDLTAPVVAPSVDPADADGDNGWYVGSPAVSFDVTDPDSAISDQTGCGGPQVVNTDTTGTTFTCEATSLGGTSSEEVTIKRDATAPSFAPALTTAAPRLRGAIKYATNASDATSGLGFAECDGITTATAGVHTANCTAVDNAGNQTHESFGYLVQYGMHPVTVVGKRRPDGTIRITTVLRDASGAPITNQEARALGCRVKVRITGAQARRSCLTYRAATHTFNYVWQVGPRTGTANVKVSVGYPHTSTVTARTKSVQLVP